MKNTNQNSGSKTAFKPLIATSLALALGVSVASATGEITESTTLDTEIAADAYVTNGTDAAGLLINPATSPITLTIKNFTIEKNTTNTSDKNVSGILVGSGSVNFVSEPSATKQAVITIKGVAASGVVDSANATAYIFKNSGTAVAFKNVAMVASATDVSGSLPANPFGIYNNVDNAVYAFGSGTSFEGADGVEGSINGGSLTGVILTAAATLGGTLNVTGGNGYAPSASTRAIFNNKDGGNGGNATGMQIGFTAANTLTVDTNGLTLNVTGGNGGAGVNGGANGTGGNATGIVSTAASTVSGGNITLNLVAGNNGGSTTANPNAILTAIDNQGGTTTLAFDNGVNVGVGSEADDAIALKSNLADVIYKFGAGTDSTFGTTFTITGATPTSAGVGSSVTGVKILQDALFGGKVSFSATGGDGNSGSGGNAVGLEITSSTLSFDTGSALKITADGGAKVTSGTNGTATGIIITSGNFDASKATGGINLTVGNTNASSAIALDLTDATFSGDLTVTAVGNRSATSATLIKNRNTADKNGDMQSTIIKSGTITLASGVSAASDSGKKIIDNSGTLIFGVLADTTNKVEASNASLVIGVPTLTGDTAPKIKNYGFVNQLASDIDFGSSGGVIFNITGDADKIAAGSVLETATSISGKGVFNIVATGTNGQAAGLISKANQTVLGNLTFNVSGGEGSNVGAYFEVNSTQALTFNSSAGNNSITLNVDSDKSATGIVISGGALTIQDNTASKANNLGLNRFVFNVGSNKASEAVGIGLTGAAGNALAPDNIGSIAGDLTFNSGTIGNDDYTTTAIALYVGQYGSISDQSITLSSATLLKGEEKYLIYQEDSAAQITFENGSSSKTNKITAGAVPDTETRAYGIYAGIADVGYKFGTTNGASFEVTGVAGASTGAAGSGAAGAIIAESTFIEGTATFAVKGGNGTAASGGAKQNGGAAVGIEVAAGKTLTATNATLTLTVDGGAASTNGTGDALAGNVTGISVGAGGSFLGNALTLKLGNTKANDVVAISLAGGTEAAPTVFSGSFTADGTSSTIGHSSNAATVTLIKNTGATGVSTIQSGAIKVIGSSGFLASGTTTIINNTGTLNFGVLDNPDIENSETSNASLTIAGDAKDVAASGVFYNKTYGFANNVDGTSINFGIANFNTTGAVGKSVAGTDAAGMIMAGNTTLQGTITFNTLGGGSDTLAGGNAYGIDVDATGGKTLAITSGSITLNVDGGVGKTNGTATGLYIQGGALTLAGNGGLDLQVGTTNASEATAFHFANSGSISKGAIALLNDSDQIGNTTNTQKATAVFIANNSDQSGFQLNIEDGVLQARAANAEESIEAGKKYVLDVENGRSSAITFTRNDSASQYITAGDATKVTDIYGLYSGIAGVSYNFGNIVTTLAAGTNFTVENTQGSAVGAILAANTTFEGNAAFNVTAKDGSSAVGIRLDNDIDLTADFSYTGSSVNAGATGTAIALQTTGTTHTISGNIAINNLTLTGATKYIFQNAGTQTTFDGSLTVGDTTSSAYATLGTLGLYNNFTGANYAFGTKTTFNVIGVAGKNAVGAYLYNNGTDGVNFSGNVVFNVTGGDYVSTTGAGTGLYSDSAVTLTLAPNSTMTFNVDSGEGANGEARGIQVVAGALTINTLDAEGASVSNGTRGFIFNVGATNATTATAIDLGYGASAAGTIVGDLYVGAGSIIGNDTKATDVTVVRLSDYRSVLSDTTNGQNIIVENGATLKTNNKIPYIFTVESFNSSVNTTDVERTQAINFVNDNTNSKNVISNTITVGDATDVTDFYGLYNNFAKEVAYNFGYTQEKDTGNKTIANATAGTIFTVTNVNGNATGAILASNTTFEGKAAFKVTAKDGNTAVGIRLDNTSNFGGDFSYTGSSVDAGTTGTAIALQTTGTHTISGNITINSDILTGKTKYIFQNTNTSTTAGTTFNGSLTVDKDSNYSPAEVYGLYSDLTGAQYAFGGLTTFNVNGNATTTKAVGLNLAATDGTGIPGTALSGNVVFNVTSGIYSGTAGDAIGLVSSTAQTLKMDSTSTVTFNVDTNSAGKGKAKGMSITGGALTLSGAEDNSFLFNIGKTNAQIVSGIELDNNGSINAIRIADNSVFGNEDYTNDLSVIRVVAGTTPITGDIIIGNATLKAQEGVNKYILNNASNQALNFGTSSISVGTNSLDRTQEKFGLYSNIAGVSYNFGTTQASFTVNGFSANTAGTTSANGGNASGIILANDARFEGKAKFTVTGGQGTTGKGGNAYGIQAISGNATLTLAENANLEFEITGGNGSTQGEAKGIYANNGTLQIVKEDTDGSTTNDGVISFTIGNITDQKVSSGVSLDNGVFDGTITFSGVKASESAYGISNANESIIKKGTISFDKAAFQDVENWAVIQNDGNLTIARDANIVAGATTANFTEDKGVTLSEAGIYDAIENATYNLGNLNLDVAKNKETTGNLYGIYSATTTNAFNVAAGSTVDISAVDAQNTKAFGGSVNLNLASGEQTNVYLNTDGGSIANLRAGENAYIYLSGSSKADRVGHTSKLSFRTLSIDLLNSAPTAATKAVANTTSKGANFVVLADATRSNGTTYDATTGQVTAAQGSAYNLDGSVSTTGGSDRIVINYEVANMSSVSAIDSTLRVGLSSLGNKEDQKYVVLAQVANGYTNITNQQGENTRLHDLVTFNGLTSNGDSVEVQTQVGFDTATITIQRHDLSTEEQTGEFAGVGAVYVSSLQASDIKIDSNISDASVSAISTNLDLISANLNSLSKRMGELRNTDNAQGVWGRVFAGQQTSNFGIEQTSTYLTFQAGYDYNISLESAVNYSGLALSYVHGLSKQAKTDFLLNAAGDKVAGNASASTDGVEVALYNSYIADMGLYSDSIVKFGYFTSDLDIPAQTETYNTTNFSFAISEEIGYRVKLGAQDEWFIDPQAELAYAFISGSDFTQKIGSASLKTSQDAASLLRARVGAAWGYKFDHLGKDKGIKASLYLGTYYAYDVISGGDVNLETNNGTTTTQSLESNGRFVLNVGTDVSVQDNTKFYVDFEKSFGSTMQTDYQVSVGVRYSFGAKDASVKKDEKKEAPLKVSDTNAENN